MTIPHAMPGEIVDVRPLGDALATTGTRTLVKTTAIDVIRMVVPAGKEIPTHTAKGELVVQCLEGKITFTACGRTHDLVAGLKTGHSLKSGADADAQGTTTRTAS